MKLLGLTEKQAVSLLEYLAKQPYNQVAGFIADLQRLPQIEVSERAPGTPVEVSPVTMD